MFKRIFTVTLVFICITLLFSLTASAQEYIVKMKENGVMLFSTGAAPLYAEKNLYLTDGETAAALLECGMAERITPNHTVTLFSDWEENEEFTNCPALSTIDVTAAWNYETYGNEVRVGVIDSGCYPHTELTNNLIAGKNYTTEGDETNTSDTTSISHGTHVCGIIAASLDGNGMAGAAPKAKIIPLKFHTMITGTVAEIIPAIYDAVRVYDCDVINMSFGFSSDNPELREALEFAYNSGVVLVAATGNWGAESDTSVATAPQYPAAYDFVIGVAASDINNSIWKKTQRNSTATLAAPGVNIYSLAKDNSYHTQSGTSMATPYVSAAAALALSFDPALTPAEIMTLLENSTHAATGSYAAYGGAGVLDIGLMVQNLLSNKEMYLSPINDSDTQFSSTLFNLSDEDITASSIWFGGGKATSSPFTLNAGDKIIFTSNLSNPRLFLWNSLEQIIPITQSR